MPTCTPAPACRALLAESTRLYPTRRTTSDGICASPKHTTQNPGSDHEPHVVIGLKHYATAVDLSDDKASGCDADLLAEQLRVRRDWRVKYVICNRRMFSSYATSKRKAWTWGPYTGPNPHESHTHISIVPEAIHDTGPWWVDAEEMTMDDEAKHAFAAMDGRLDVITDAVSKIAGEVAILRSAVKGVADDANGMSWLGERVAEIKADLDAVKEAHGITD